MLKKYTSSVMAAAIAWSGAAVAPAAAAGESGASGAPAPLKTWYARPATSWESEAIPLGNGHMGAMVFGGVDREQVLINEKTLWSGGPGANPDYDGGHKDTPAYKHENLQQARAQLQEAMTAFSQGTPPYKDEHGNVIARNYEVPESVRQLINGVESSETGGLIGTKRNFGSFQELGSIWLSDPNAAEPSITRIHTDQDHVSNASENVQKLFDGSVDTKYFADGHAGEAEYVIEWDYSKAFPASSYAITTGNDVQGRDPKDWTLTASADGVEWITIDSVTGFELAGRKQTQSFELDVPGSYRYFRLAVTALFGTSQAIQMSELAIVPDESELPPDRVVTDYRRELDLRSGTAGVSYLQGGAAMRREYFVNYPDNVLAIRLRSEEAGRLNRFISVTSAQQRKTIVAAGDTITMTGWPNDHHKDDAATNFDNTLHFAQQIKVIPTGGTMLAQDNGILVENADEIVILMTAGTNYQQSMDDRFDYFTGVDPLIAVSERLEAAATRGFDELYERHLGDYKELFDRVELNLMNAAFPNKPTDELLEGYARTNAPAEDRYLEQLYYQFGRYLLIASSREGSLPANLQGVWASGLNPPWSADYHANINLQMNYWLAEQTNLSEANIPLMQFIKSLVPRGEISAQHGYVTPAGGPVRGWTAHHEINIWGNTAPATSGAFFSPEDGAWLAQHLWERYQFTMDEQFLRDNYEIMLGAALFWVDNLWEDERDGTLVANPSYSPEHGPYSLGATEVQSVIWGIFEEVVRASEVLGIASPEVEEIAAAQSRLAGPRIGLGGQFMEWKDEVAMDITGDNGHRHVNHLYALHPGSQIVAGRSEQDDRFAEAMKVTLNTRGDGGTGWSKAWKINFWARLHDGDRAQKLLKELLYESTLSNLFDTHPPFQIDGNFGATAGMTELLLQSQGGAVQLLPALPSKWRTGSVTGLKARGNVEVDMAWEESHLTSAVLMAGTAGPIAVKGTNIAMADIRSGGEPVAFETVDADTIVIQAQQGATYEISGIPEAALSHDAFATIDAVDADVLYGNITKSATTLQEAGAGDYAMFRNVRFGDGASRVLLEVASDRRTPGELGRIELRLDRPDGEPIASILADYTGEMNVYKLLSGRLSAEVTGTHDLYVSFTRPSYLKSLRFAADEAGAEATGIDVRGSTLVPLQSAGRTDVVYTASVAHADGSTETASSAVTWSLGGGYTGVKLTQDGTLSIREGMGSQDIAITATSVRNPEISRQIPVRLVTGTIHSTILRGIDRDGQSGGSNPQGHMQISDNWVEFVSPNGWLKFSGVDLKDGLEGVTVGYASPSERNRQIQIRVAEPGQGTVVEAETVASLDISASTGGWQALDEVSTEEAADAYGMKDVYIFWPEGDFNLSYVTLLVLEADEGSAVYRDVVFEVTPADASIVVQDAEGYMYSAGGDGRTFRLPEDTLYTYTVTWEGFPPQSGDFTAETAGGTIAVAPEADRSAPTWPDGSSLAAANAGTTGLTLTWTAAEDNIGVTGYRLYVGGELLTTVTGSVYSYDVSGLTPDTGYTFKVEAGDAAGNWSNDGPTTVASTLPGDPPADVTAPTWPAGSTLAAANAGTTGLTLNWSAAADNIGVTGYRLYVGGELLTTVTGSVYSYDVSGLTPDTGYTFKVEAGDAAGNWSNDGPTTVASTLPGDPPADVTAPTWPAGSSLRATNVGTSRVTLHWPDAVDDTLVDRYKLYQGSELLATVDGNVHSYTVTGLRERTRYTFKVEAGDAAGNWSLDGPQTTVRTDRDDDDDSGSGGSGNNGGGGGPGIDTPPAGSGEPNRIVAPVPVLNDAGRAATSVDEKTFNAAAASSDNIFIRVPAVGGAAGYEVTLPASVFAAGNAAQRIEVATEMGTATLSPAMLSIVEIGDAERVTLSIALADIGELPQALRAEIGDRPVLDISLMVDGALQAWSNPDAPVALFIPYTPSAAEAADPEHIVVWYIDDEGQAIPVPTGRYDAGRGGVTFATTHFGKFAVVYVTKTFDDIAAYEWAERAIEVMASKGVIYGTSAASFAPEAAIKRADFILLLVRALGLNASRGDNFADVRPEAYYADALAIAKKRGIAQGVGGGRFNPEAPISRQDMMVLIDRAMATAGKELAAGAPAALDGFADEASVAAYARQSAATLVHNGIVTGDGTGINPLGHATRAETAVLIYRVYNK